MSIDLHPKQWGFTGTQIMKGEVKYTLDDYWHDMFAHFKATFGKQLPPEKLLGGFMLVWAFVNLRANMKSLEETKEEINKENPITQELLEFMDDFHKDDIEILIGIKQKLLLDFIPAGYQTTFGDEKKADQQAIDLVNTYIHEHLHALVAEAKQEISGRKKRKRGANTP